ncbi:chromosome segregation protein SMC (plasmid) [Legionella adelaidensis]|uniref:Chromosome partition protein Smc n=1 Tax=Legionella adelaidensis TaxID=45056 RepID=A0A0W0R5R1_9GAMM|nr:chromosome segregation protein SMC [Legionella adelaidensis]KTC66436.1 chromosome segregation SMC protein [Legionella adelaidensis]VEH86276.1 chromosome segregation protein SMC [Legionella adelaidensis]
MQLKELKLSGFKSFVEPTTVSFPSQLVGVVGPNGCGKSNIIDAVRWVMGESSAKNLRGEAMTDVIFNGSSTRKPVGQAAVELVFDNSLGRLSGQYASYQEISIKRVVSRDGDSNYFLNGSRCRRRDVVDIFLGTGAGAKGYAIIGQDMISRLIEARPDDLKVYLEEAAGISKYKDRRRETLLRINQTRENLSRVADIREELSKQLARLEKQAKAAERFKLLKEKERQLKGEIFSLKWAALNNEQEVLTKNSKALTFQSEEYETQATLLAKEELLSQNELQTANELFQEIQNQFFKAGTDIARLEESIQQSQKEKHLFTKNKEELTLEYHHTIEKIEEEKVCLIQLETQLIELEKKVKDLQEAYQSQKSNWDKKEKEHTKWNNDWREIQEKLNASHREKQEHTLVLKNLHMQREQLLVRLEKITHEKESLPIEILQKNAQTLRNEKTILEKEITELQSKLAQISENNRDLKKDISGIEHQLNIEHDQLKHIAAKKAALEAAQQAALKNINDPEKLAKWATAPRLVSKFSIEEKWRTACELVFAEALQAVVIEEWDELLKEANTINHPAYFVSSQTNFARQTHPRLVDKIQGVVPAIDFLHEIYLAESLEEALSLVTSLKSNQSVITPQGVWVGHGWLKVAASNSEKEGLIARQDTLNKLTAELVQLEEKIQKLQEKRNTLHSTFSLNKEEEEKLFISSRSLQSNILTLEAQFTSKTKEFENNVLRKNALQEEEEEKRYQLETICAEIERIKDLCQKAEEQLSHAEIAVQNYNKDREAWEKTLQIEKKTLETVLNELHQQELQYDREKNKKQQSLESQTREIKRAESIQLRLEKLEKQFLELVAPSNKNEETLKQKLTEYQHLEKELISKKEKINQLQEVLQQTQQKIKDLHLQNKNLVELIQQNKLAEQALQIKKASLEEALYELNLQATEVLSTLTESKDIHLLEKELLETQEKIKRLGAINLIAIEEYQEENGRKQQLDVQYSDLNEALSTLELAIAQMDKETQARLRDTFNQINSSFQSLFPRLFGGGRAMLELTCDNLLEAGVLVMAQPPGKRNSSIHMLSGGEKAMTAVALVFAIFQLNPSPFCMLDEVDAPLDDVNVRRFCDLVKEMSEFVQFLFITHNKVTMELADHLIGVTMREPGVSRVVAVDVEQALAIAE